MELWVCLGASGCVWVLLSVPWCVWVLLLYDILDMVKNTLLNKHQKQNSNEKSLIRFLLN